MKVAIILCLVFISAFASGVEAQRPAPASGHVKVFDGSNYWLLAPATQSTPTNALPVMELVAGQPIRVRVPADTDGRDDIIVSRTSTGHVKTFAMPCENVPVVVRKAGDDKRQDYLTITLKDVVVSSTQPSWKATCRLLTVETRDGSRYAGRIRFR